MYNRTSAANRAVEKAWEQEIQHVLDGKGTRNWTPDQQREIILIGKAFDSNGAAFQGHHMKSVEAYPRYQGRCGNIQFLSHDEHVNGAHKGNTQNKTNGYYNPKNGQTMEFGRNLYEPCKVRKLTDLIDQKDISLKKLVKRANEAKAMSSSAENTKESDRDKAILKLKSVSQRQTTAESKMNPNPEKMREELRERQQQQANQASKAKSNG